jgi:hypothetical protein
MARSEGRSFIGWQHCFPPDGRYRSPVGRLRLAAAADILWICALPDAGCTRGPRHEAGETRPFSFPTSPMLKRAPGALVEQLSRDDHPRQEADCRPTSAFPNGAANPICGPTLHPTSVDFAGLYPLNQQICFHRGRLRGRGVAFGGRAVIGPSAGKRASAGAVKPGVWRAKPLPVISTVRPCWPTAPGPAP